MAYFCLALALRLGFVGNTCQAFCHQCRAGAAQAAWALPASLRVGLQAVNLRHGGADECQGDELVRPSSASSFGTAVRHAQPVPWQQLRPCAWSQQVKLAHATQLPVLDAWHLPSRTASMRSVAPLLRLAQLARTAGRCPHCPTGHMLCMWTLQSLRYGGVVGRQVSQASLKAVNALHAMVQPSGRD
jgi:hypothetical protein